MSRPSVIISRHFSALSPAPEVADARLLSLASQLAARGWIADTDVALCAQELASVQALGLLAVSDDAPQIMAARLEDALSGPQNASYVVAGVTPRLPQFLDVLAAQAAVVEQLPPAVQIPVEHLACVALHARPLRSALTQVAAAFGQSHMIDALEDVMDSCDRNRVLGFDPRHHLPLARAIAQARALGVPDGALAAAVALAQDGEENMAVLARAVDQHGADDPAPPPPLIIDMPDAFIEAALTGHSFAQHDGADGAAQSNAAALLSALVDSLWFGVATQLSFRDRAAAAHDAGCVLGVPVGIEIAPGALNLLPFVTPRGIDVAGLVAAARLATLALAAGSRADGAVVLSLTNIAAAVMSAGLAYDSAGGRTLAATLSALVTATMIETLAQAAAALGVVGQHSGREGRYAQQLTAMRQRLAGAAFAAGELGRGAQAVSAAALHDASLKLAVVAALDAALAAVRKAGVAVTPLTMVATPAVLNARLGVRTPDLLPEQRLVDIAPEGGTPSDNDVLTRSYRRALNPCVVMALLRLGYTAQQIDDIGFYVLGHATLLDAPHVNHARLRLAGCDEAALMRIERALALASNLRHALNVHVLGRDWCAAVLGLDGADDDVLAALGLSDEEVEAASAYACGAQTLAGAPHLDPAHLPVFDIDSGLSPVSAQARVLMQAAIEPFLTGAALQTITCPAHISRDDLAALILSGWEAGVKNIALYRAGSGLDVPVALTVSEIQSADKKEKIERLSRQAALTSS